jgi:hypothetical protein
MKANIPPQPQEEEDDTDNRQIIIISNNDITPEMHDNMSSFLMRATNAHQFHFDQVRSLLDGLLLDRLSSLLGDQRLCADWCNYSFYFGNYSPTKTI